MESVFYKYGYKKRFPVTYLFLELFAKSVENSDPESEITEVLFPVLNALGFKPPYQENFILQILQDMDEYRKKKEGIDSASHAKGKKRSFGTEFIKWFSSLEQDQVLLLVTDYDFEAAYKLYSEVPVSVVERMIETKIGYEWTKAEKDFEAVVFGMGGTIKGGSAGQKSYDAPKTENELHERNVALKKLGFM